MVVSSCIATSRGCDCRRVNIVVLPTPRRMEGLGHPQLWLGTSGRGSAQTGTEPSDIRWVAGVRVGTGLRGVAKKFSGTHLRFHGLLAFLMRRWLAVAFPFAFPCSGRSHPAADPTPWPRSPSVQSWQRETGILFQFVLPPLELTLPQPTLAAKLPNRHPTSRRLPDGSPPATLHLHILLPVHSKPPPSRSPAAPQMVLNCQE
jgi:hypothetical protein